MNLPEQVLGNIFRRRNIGKAGDVVGGYPHKFDHVTYVVQGRVSVLQERPGQAPRTKEFGPGDCFLTYADTPHTITFLEDGIFDCLYSHRDAQGRVVQRYDGFYDATT